MTLRNFASQQGFVGMVEGGNTRFALEIIDPAKAKKFFAANTNAQIRDNYKEGSDKSSGGNSRSHTAAILKVLGSDSGMSYYETTDPQKFNFKLIEKIEDSKFKR